MGLGVILRLRLRCVLRLGRILCLRRILHLGLLWLSACSHGLLRLRSRGCLNRRLLRLRSRSCLNRRLLRRRLRCGFGGSGCSAHHSTHEPLDLLLAQLAAAAALLRLRGRRRLLRRRFRHRRWCRCGIFKAAYIHAKSAQKLPRQIH